ncbi:Hypothetical predicted protein [Paramuricea clavata]|uniref:Uncharacterized protein n=1 Tax=Paramuricea clavata TaxID=317549 RepID=A0A6S7INQ5_PARCT|nr:Hypothetical predicted protein [Paramuricea clavata]
MKRRYVSDDELDPFSEGRKAGKPGRPSREPPKIPEGAKQWRPTPKPRTRPTPRPRTRPLMTKPTTALPRTRPTPRPRTRPLMPKAGPKTYTSSVHINLVKPKTLSVASITPIQTQTPPTKQVKPTVKSSIKINLKKPAVTQPKPKIRKPEWKMREVEPQAHVLQHTVPEIDPFGTDLQKPNHRKIETAANGAAVTYSISPAHIDPLEQLTSSRQVVRDILVKELRKMGGLKYTETMKVRMSKEVGEGKTKKDSVYFKSKTGTVTNFEDVESTAAGNEQLRIEAFQNLGSNWKIMNIESHYLNIAMYKSLKGSSYIRLPEDINNPMSGLINLRNDDEMCFLWCHVRHHRPTKNNPTYITKNDRNYGDTLDYEGIEIQVKVGDIGKIEKKNKINITVFGYKGKKQFYPIRVSKEEYGDHMELLLLGDGEGGLHYVLIKDVNRLLCGVTKNKIKKHFCLYCFHNCDSEESLAKHKETCILVNRMQAVKLPKEGTKISFQNDKNQLPAPFVIYADFESLLVSDRDRKMDNTVDESYTNRYQTHHACSFGFKRVCHYDDKY